MLRQGGVWRVCACVLALSAVVIGRNARAQDDREKPEPRLLTVRAEAYVEAEPDVAKISLGIEAVKPKPKEAAGAVADTANAVKAKLTELGVPRDAVETSELYLGEVVHYDYRKGRRLHQGYRAYHWLRVTLKNADFEKLPAVVEGAVDAGATSFGGLRFEMLDDTALQAEALAKAVTNARIKAEAMAKAAGTRMVGVHRITEVEQDYWDNYLAEDVDAAEAPEEEAEPVEGTPLEELLPGKLRVTRRVEVAFLLE